ncbi:MAG: hypothetical protein ACK5C0_11695 [Candidatus Kapaibacterium sp.]|jgi:hypothetical protein|nr:hypothetical protein [Candidatus Kapabacteria bacterium]
MKSIPSLASIEGRALLHAAYKELRYERRNGMFSTLIICWRICTTEQSFSRYTSIDYSMEEPLGIVSGTSLWMQEIINRFHFATVNSFVYFGAAILLVVIGLRRVFDAMVPDTVVISSIVLEAMMLIFMFVVMFFTPSDAEDIALENKDEHKDPLDEIVREIGEISRDYASISVRLDSIADNLETIVKIQEELTGATHTAIRTATAAVAPNPELLQTMQMTTTALKELTRTVQQVTEAANSIEKANIEQAVRNELARIIGNNIQNNHA